MRMEKYYLIRPRKNLLEMLGNLDELSKGALEDSGLWMSNEGGKTLWSREDYIARVKLTFLMNLRLEYRGVAGVESVLSPNAISLALFDKFWDIESLDLLGDVEEIPSNAFDHDEVALSGLPNVDDWLVRKMLKLKV